MKVISENGGVRVSEIELFTVNQTFDCGQCFRFTVSENEACGYAFGKKVTFTQLSESELFVFPCTEDEFHRLWKSYLSLDEDYCTVRSEMKALRENDASLSAAMETGKGIRILKQEPWETLCSFIISQNNNIPRIKKIIDALCKRGAEISGGDEAAFPSPKTLIALGKDGLFELKTGFRAAYLYDAACKVDSGEVDLNKVYSLSPAEAEAELCKIKGVGPKVAACTLLFGFGKTDAFPIDVWVKRVMQEYYGGNVAPKDFGPYAGLAQQYLFYHRRYLDG